MGVRLLYLILFTEGLVSVSLQILIMRQLVPFVGNSVVTVSIIVSVFLMSLSVGYFFGGKVKNNHKRKLSFNFILSALVVSVGFSYYLMETFFALGFLDNTLINLFLYLMVFLTVPIFLLGQTIPIMTNFIKRQKVSEITGGALAINTIGSVLGSLMTSMLFLYFFGVAATVMLNVSLLLILSVIVSDNRVASVLISSLVLLLAFNMNVSFEEKRFIKTNHYANYEIKDESNLLRPVDRQLILNNSLTSINVNNQYAGQYIQFLREYLFDFLKLKDKDILILGAGGFSFSMSLEDNENRFKYIDNDPEIKDIAEKYFLQDDINGEFEVSDGRVYLTDADKGHYDVIIVDVFTNKNSIPWQFITVEFMDVLKEKVAQGGYIAINTIFEKDFSGDFAKRMHNTIIKNLNFCIVNPIIADNDQDHLNYIYICKNEEYSDTSYSDMYDKMSLDEIINRK